MLEKCHFRNFYYLYWLDGVHQWPEMHKIDQFDTFSCSFALLAFVTYFFKPSPKTTDTIVLSTFQNLRKMLFRMFNQRSSQETKANNAKMHQIGPFLSTLLGHIGEPSWYN